MSFLCQRSWTSCFCFFSLQREPFGDSNPGRDAESMSPGEKSCLGLQKAYLQQAVLVTFIKIEHWAFLLPCFLCFWQEVVIVNHWLHCAQQCGESLAARVHGDDKTVERAWRKEGETPSFVKAPVGFIDCEGVFVGGVKPAMSLNFPNLWSLAVLHQDQLEDLWSLVGTFVIIYWVWHIPHIEGEDRKSMNWIGLPGPQGGLLTLACVVQFSTLLCHASAFTSVWTIKLNFIKTSWQQKGEI